MATPSLPPRRPRTALLAEPLPICSFWGQRRACDTSLDSHPAPAFPKWMAFAMSCERDLRARIRDAEIEAGPKRMARAAVGHFMNSIQDLERRLMELGISDA